MLFWVLVVFFWNGWGLCERRRAVLLPRQRLLAGMPEACPQCLALPSSGQLAAGLLPRGDQPRLSSVLAHQRGRPTTEDAPPAPTHPEVHHMPAASTSRHHMHCQPLFRNTSRSHTSIQAKQLQQDSPDYHHIRKQKRPNIRHSLAVNCRMSIVYHMSYNRLCAPTQCTPN